jgi:hypothetical protein
MGRRAKRKPAIKICMTHGCEAEIPRWQWLCRRCFHALPFARRRAIAEACQARAPQRIFGLCRDAAKWLLEQRIKASEA